MGESVIAYQITEDQLNDMIKRSALIAAYVAMGGAEKEKQRWQKEQRDWRLHNTRLLLKHYRDFKEHCKQGIYDSRMVETDEDIMLSLMSVKDDSVFLESVTKSILRTRTLIEHMDNMLSVYKSIAKDEGEVEQRRYKIVRETYISPKKKTTKELADEMKVSVRTIQIDLKTAEEKLSVLFFGADGIKL